MTDSSNGVTIYYEPEGCNCDGRSTYDRQAIHAACVQALTLASEGQQVGHDKYPHAYNDYEKFKFSHAVKPYFEFPIMSNGSAYDGDGSPGADRIVIGSVASDYSSAVYCATITHDGQKNDKFIECQNVSEEDYERKRPPEGRDTLSAEDVKLPFQ